MPFAPSSSTSARGARDESETVGGVFGGSVVRRLLSTTTGVEPYGHGSNDTTTPNVFRPMTIASTLDMNCEKPKSSPEGAIPFALSSQSMAPSILAMKPSRLTPTNTEHLEGILKSPLLRYEVG